MSIQKTILCGLCFMGVCMPLTFPVRAASLADLFHAHEGQDHPVVRGMDDWLFFLPELRHLRAGPFWGEDAQTASRARRPDTRDPLPAILDFHQALHARGVHLLVVPVPPKAVVYDAQLPAPYTATGERNDPQLQTFYTLLREHGVDVLDLTDLFRTEAPAPGGDWYCRQDTHWSGVAVVRAAREIARRAASYVEISTDPALETDWRTVPLTGDLWSMLGEDAIPRESVLLRVVEASDLDPSSPVVLLGDSHTLVFHAGGDMHYRHAGLPDQLAVELGQPVDLIGVRGSGATPARVNLFRRAQRDPAYWDGKKLLIWVFAAREFTESDGWRMVPIEPSR